jgi:8-oxo-dGTP diphosphatase
VAVLDRFHRFSLRLYRRLPTLARRWLVRVVAPSYTVGAICVVERPDGHVLLVRQAYRNGWGLPGGHLKRREDAAVAAVREVREEVGCDIELVGEPAVVVDAIPQRVDIVYRARPAPWVPHSTLGELAPRSPEIVEVAWFAPDALPQLQPEAATAMVSLAKVVSEPLLQQPRWPDR